MMNVESIILALAYGRIHIVKYDIDSVNGLIDELDKIRSFKTSRYYKPLFIRRPSGEFYTDSEQKNFITKNSLKIDWLTLGKEDSTFDISIQSLLCGDGLGLDYAVGIKNYPFLFFPYNYVNGIESLYNLETHELHNVVGSTEFEDTLLLPTSSQCSIITHLDSLLKDAEDGKFQNSDAIIRKVTGLKKELEKL